MKWVYVNQSAFRTIPKEIFFSLIPYCDQIGGTFPAILNSFLDTFITCSIKSHFLGKNSIAGFS